MSQALHAVTADDGDESNRQDDLPFSLPIELVVEDRDTIESLCQLPEGSGRDQYALAALRIGVLALKHVHDRVDVEGVRREGARMIDLLREQLSQHASHLHERITGELTGYFDPQNGRFHERVERLVRKDGELESVLRRQLGAEDSSLSKTLLAHVGENSPLMRILKPNESEGILSALRKVIDSELAGQRERILREFSLDNDGSALRRLVRELTNNSGVMTKNLTEKIDEVVKEFSLDQEGSALKRLVDNVDAAQKRITQEFSLDNQQSAFTRLKVLLEDTQGAIHKNLTLDEEGSPLARLKRELLTILKEHWQTNQSFQEEVKVSLARLVTTREAAARGTQHGIQFEDAVCTFLGQLAQGAGDVASPTGHTVGMIKNCKIGDCVVELGPDSPAPGAKIVFEAKEDVGVTLAAARDEISKARDNRGAQLGVFVYSKKTAPAGLEPFARYGNDLVVIWDIEDPATDIYLKAGLITARALCIRARRSSDQQDADLVSIERAVLEIEKRASSLEEVGKWAETTRNASEKIIERIRIVRQAFEKQVEQLRTNVDELKSSLAQGEGG